MDYGEKIDELENKFDNLRDLL